ncbi:MULTISPECIES: SH3 domain-containing protein [Actinomycetes]|uniref:SH3 domain-containing protein n=1 Tax=Actinomycetes TaxID=1760 RepID=UPI003440DD87
MKTLFSSPRQFAVSTAGVLLAGALAFGGLMPASAAQAIPAAQPSTQLAAPATLQVHAAKRVVQVKTTSNLNMRSGSSTKYRVVLTIPKNKTVTVKSQASNGWYQVTYNKKTGWISNKYTKVTKTSGTGKTSPRAKSVKLWITPKSTMNIRKGAGTGHSVVGKISKGQPAYATSKATNGWYKISTQGKNGWISGAYVTTCSQGCAIDAGPYTTNRAGLSDRYFTKSSGADLFASVKGKKRIGDIPKNSIVYRDKVWERKAGQVSGWYYVRTQGADGWMKVSALKPSTNAKTSNTSKITRAMVLKQANGKLPASMLVALHWDKEKTLVAAPAAADLGRLNSAFKKKFGKNLDIDLAYRTLDTQKFLYQELGHYIAAKPGTSNHGWGLAIDVPETYSYSFKGKYYKWLKANTKKYNWIHRKNLEEFRANGSRNPYAEAWHFEYVGK